jgi:hypothetical protein
MIVTTNEHFFNTDQMVNIETTDSSLVVNLITIGPIVVWTKEPGTMRNKIIKGINQGFASLDLRDDKNDPVEQLPLVLNPQLTKLCKKGCRKEVPFPSGWEKYGKVCRECQDRNNTIPKKEPDILYLCPGCKKEVLGSSFSRYATQCYDCVSTKNLTAKQKREGEN